MKKRILDAYAVLRGRSLAVSRDGLVSLAVKTTASEYGEIRITDAGRVVRGGEIHFTGEHH